MKEYPSTHQPFKVNGKTFKMRKLTLGLQADIEDENIRVTIAEVILNSTDMTEEDLRELDMGQIESLYDDINTFTYVAEKREEGETKKP